jgi:hypothetical protein
MDNPGALRLAPHPYAVDRERGMQRIAMKWEDIVWEAVRAIGHTDAQQWLEKTMVDLLRNPYFVADPVPYEWVAEERMRNTNPHVLGHTWVSPHPEAWHKLGYYQVWRPGGHPMVEVWGEQAVRVALLENEMLKLFYSFKAKPEQP